MLTSTSSVLVTPSFRVGLVKIWVVVVTPPVVWVVKL